jgi:hypothetical protein
MSNKTWGESFMQTITTAFALPLPGLRADSLLAFLASIGTLRTLALARPQLDPHLAWCVTGGGWQPVLHFNEACLPGEVSAWLFDALQGKDGSPWHCMRATEADPLADNLAIPGSVFATIARRAAEQATPDDRAWADFCAAYGTEAFDREADIEDTSLRTMSGAGHQHFLQSLRRLARRPAECTDGRKQKERRRDAGQPSPPEADPEGGTSVEQFERTLFAAWDYADPGPSLRWDPRDDRRYALRADEPSGSKVDPIRTMRGANRLAAEALPCFPTHPTATGAKTTGFHRRGPRLVFMWPVWEPPLRLETVRSLLAHPYVITPLTCREPLRGLGVVAVFEASRLNVGRMVNFSAGRPVWGHQPGSARAEVL